MEFEVKFYRLHDLDIVGLRDLGYPIQAMLKKALIGYANGSPVHYIVNEPNAMTLTGAKSFRVKINMKDEATIAMLRTIRSRQRNSFCKALLRNSLMHQSLAPYFTNNSCAGLENTCIKECFSGSMANVFRIDKDAMKKRNLVLKDLAVSSIVDPNKETLQKINEMYASMETLLKSATIMHPVSVNDGRQELKANTGHSMMTEFSTNTNDASVTDKLTISSNTLPLEQNKVYSDTVERTYDRSEQDAYTKSIESRDQTDSTVKQMPELIIKDDPTLPSMPNEPKNYQTDVSVSATDKDMSDRSSSNDDTEISDDLDNDDLMDMFDKLIND